MKTIHKLTLHITELQKVKMPREYQVLSVQLQNQQICLWYTFDTYMGNDYEDSEIYIFGTGSNIPDNVCYLGTVQKDDFVWHIFN